jgi:uncharacterized protein Smg (DUF494 family)
MTNSRLIQQCAISTRSVCGIIMSLFYKLFAISIDTLHFLTLLVIFAIHGQERISDSSVVFVVKGLG